ncbi:hypothetical protein PBR20603_02621 [Pandoraea bronchicola]|uniref:Uncharacterized protein n=1 Tax=Pandoraea bronchicola TaxID=2508287 RepID=A0A5E5BU38_9BURK|nr:hypothetical protein PBR20603_02621 [Pandoraea bronchicola]
MTGCRERHAVLALSAGVSMGAHVQRARGSQHRKTRSGFGPENPSRSRGRESLDTFGTKKPVRSHTPRRRVIGLDRADGKRGKCHYGCLYERAERSVAAFTTHSKRTPTCTQRAPNAALNTHSTRTQHAPNTHRTRTEHAPNTHRTRTEHAPNTRPTKKRCPGGQRFFVGVASGRSRHTPTHFLTRFQVTATVSGNTGSPRLSIRRFAHAKIAME